MSVLTDVECHCRLELTLSKSVAKTWPLVVVSDKRGEMVVDPNEAAVIHERLAHLTSETLVGQEWLVDSGGEIFTKGIQLYAGGMFP